MTTVYTHKKHGFQVSFKLYLPDGRMITRHRYRKTRPAAMELARKAEYLENGSRACNLAPKELIQAQHDGLLSEQEARLFAGTEAVVAYDLDRCS